MKTAVIYYSFGGNCALVAETIKAAIGADTFEVKTKNAKKRTGFAKYFWGGAQAVFGIKPPIVPLTVDISAYDLVILGTPVWAASPAPAMVSFLNKTVIKGKKIAIFCCHSGGMKKTLEKFKALLKGNTIVGEIDFQNAAKNGRTGLKPKIEEWVKSITA